MIPDQSSEAEIAYLVHDITDAAVRRRTMLFAGEGLSVRLAGFKRRSTCDGQAAQQVFDLGTTRDAHLLGRAMAVLKLLLRPRQAKSACKGAGTIVARNLEMLLVAQRVRLPGQRLVYECLDIHRLMLGHTAISSLLRWVERQLLAKSNLVIVSSPAFAERYFAQRQRASGKVITVENKVAELPVRISPSLAEGQKASLVVGWFGMLRCRRTLDELISLVHTGAGRIKVVIAGVPSSAIFENLEQEIADVAHITYIGPYEQSDISTIYAGVDFVWAIDYYEEGLNSEWLLPNRLYEGLSRGSIPIALRHVETGRWLSRNGVGLLVDDAEKDLASLLNALTPSDLEQLKLAVSSLPYHAFCQLPLERRTIVKHIMGIIDA